MSDSIILGIGLDLVEVARIRSSVERSGERFVKRIFTPGEIEYCAGRPRKFEHLAARFAAKEATLKALGSGITSLTAMREVEVIHDSSGRPRIVLRGGALQRARLLGVAALHVSLSHTEQLAAAQVVLEGARFTERANLAKVRKNLRRVPPSARPAR